MASASVFASMVAYHPPAIKAIDNIVAIGQTVYQSPAVLLHSLKENYMLCFFRFRFAVMD
jgi:hypothetical protein